MRPNRKFAEMLYSRRTVVSEINIKPVSKAEAMHLGNLNPASAEQWRAEQNNSVEALYRTAATYRTTQLPELKCWACWLLERPSRCCYI